MADEITQDTPTHSEEFVLKSEGLRMLNYQIDTMVAGLNARLAMLKDRFERAFGLNEGGFSYGGPRIETRVSYDDTTGQRGTVPLLGSVRELMDMREDIERVADLERQIRSLQTLKLRLFNDYDFTKGFPEDQIAFFGPAPAPTEPAA